MKSENLLLISTLHCLLFFSTQKRRELTNCRENASNFEIKTQTRFVFTNKLSARTMICYCNWFVYSCLEIARKESCGEYIMIVMFFCKEMNMCAISLLSPTLSEFLQKYYFSECGFRRGVNCLVHFEKVIKKSQKVKKKVKKSRIQAYCIICGEEKKCNCQNIKVHINSK